MRSASVYVVLVLIQIMIGALLPVKVQSATYKCVIPGGQIEYRATALEGADCVDLNAAQKGPANSEQTNQDKQKAGEENKQDEAQNQQQEKPKEPKKSKEERYAEYCETARSNLEILQSDADIVRSDPSGKKMVLSDEQRQQSLEQTQKDITYFCAK